MVAALEGITKTVHWDLTWYGKIKPGAPLRREDLPVKGYPSLAPPL